MVSSRVKVKLNWSRNFMVKSVTFERIVRVGTNVK